MDSISRTEPGGQEYDEDPELPSEPEIESDLDRLESQVERGHGYDPTEAPRDSEIESRIDHLDAMYRQRASEHKYSEESRYGEALENLDAEVFELLEPERKLMTDGGPRSPEGALDEARDHQVMMYDGQDENEAGGPLPVEAPTSMYEQEVPGEEMERQNPDNQYENPSSRKDPWGESSL